MFFILSKILSILIHPLFWLIISLLTWIFIKTKKWKKCIKVTFIVLFFLFTNKFLVIQFQRLWEFKGSPIEKINVEYDVAVVLGGMAEYNNDLKRTQLSNGGDRIWNALRLYHLGKVKKILISGADGKLLDQSLNEARAFKKDLILFGVPEVDILIEDRSKNTHENAVFTAELLRKENLHHQKILLITSAMHMKRALACFEKEGLNVDTFPTDHNTGSFYLDWGQLLLPDVKAITLWHQLFHEMTGYIVYKIMGYA